MASKVSGSRKLKRNSLPKFKADVYSKIPPDGLIVFAIYYLIEQKIEITLEDIVSVCFLLFPRRFGLKRYPRWPDSAPISRHWGEVRRKRYVTANEYLGYRLTSKGTRLVKRAAKALGVKMPKPIAKAQPAQPKKAIVIPEPVKQVQKPDIKPQSVQEEKVIAVVPVKKAKPVRIKKTTHVEVKQVQKPEIKAQPVQEEKVIAAAPVKKARTARVKKITSAPVEVKQTQKAEIKVQPVQEEKVIAPEPAKKARPVRVKKAVPVEVRRVQKPEIKVQPVREEKVILPEPAKKVKVVRAKKVAPAPMIVQPVKTAEPVSREAKERAGKFTRMMERSDAYVHYKKNGDGSKINEFDFRSLLLCTMESSAETLARNVNLFKGYAEIQRRQDLSAFLIFCEDKFSYLLKPQDKPLKREKK